MAPCWGLLRALPPVFIKRPGWRRQWGTIAGCELMQPGKPPTGICYAPRQALLLFIFFTSFPPAFIKRPSGGACFLNSPSAPVLNQRLIRTETLLTEGLQPAPNEQPDMAVLCSSVYVLIQSIPLEVLQLIPTHCGRA